MSIQIKNGAWVQNSPVKIFKEKDEGSAYVVRRLAELILSKQKIGIPAVLGLATGSTPKGVYRGLIKLHREEGLSFKNVHTFNLDEYYPMRASNELSYDFFMRKQLFDHIDIPDQNIHTISGTVACRDVERYCTQYESKISALGGIDIQLLGIGRTGHIGFNEPGSRVESKTRLVTLAEMTRKDAISEFGGLQNVPLHAITMGVNTILNAKEILMIAWGERKSKIIQKAIEGGITAKVPASYLLAHPSVEVILDQDAASWYQKT